MKKLSAIVLFCSVMLSGCGTSETISPTLMPANTVLPASTIPPVPTQTNTPIPNTLFNVNRFSFITLNSIASVALSDLIYDMWIVGNDGLIFRYNVDISHFSIIDTPVKANLYNVEFVSSDDGWAVGEGSLILHWDGEEWKISRQAIGRGGPYTYDLYKVAFTETNDVWAAGCSGSEGGEYFLAYHWDGMTWSEVSFPEDLYPWGCIHDVVALTSTDVWLVGTGWNDGKEYGLTVHWDGERWNVIPELRTYNILSMSALSSNDIWAITRYGIVLHWNGTKWSEVTQLDSAGSFSAPVIYAQGPDDVFVASNKVWHWDGKDWTDISVSSNIEADSKIIDMIAFPSPAFPLETWMLDSSGMIYTFHRGN